jgi:hypothetical protein
MHYEKSGNPARAYKVEEAIKKKLFIFEILAGEIKPNF